MASFKILDGAMGSELIKRGFGLHDYTWSAEANMNCPELVEQIHREYVDAGAEYLTANTFRTTPRAYLKTGINNEKSVQMAKNSLMQAVRLAKKAAGASLKVIGSIAPLEDCYKPELFPESDIALSEFSQLGGWLSEAGIDILLLETMNSIAETEAGLIAFQPFSQPCWVSFILQDESRLLSGDFIVDALEMVKSYSVECIMLNCNPLDRTLSAVDNIVDNWRGYWGIYPNLGIGEPSKDGYISEYEPLEKYLSVIEHVINLGATILGACCGSSPEHIHKIKNLQYDFEE